MLILVFAAFAIWRGTSVVPFALVFAAVRVPLAALAGLMSWVVVTRVRGRSGVAPDDEAAALDRIVAELDGGSSPRASLVAAAASCRTVDLDHAARVAGAGLGATEVATALRGAFPHNGPLVAAAWALAADSGAPAAPVMGLLARRAGERGRLDRERRALTAQARATAWLIAGLPLGVCLVLASTGRIHSGPALPVILAGVLLQMAGLGVVMVMLRRAA